MSTTLVVDEMLDRVLDAGIMRLREEPKDRFIRKQLEHLSETVVEARKLVESGRAPRQITHHLVTASEAQICGFILALLILKEEALFNSEGEGKKN